MFCHLAENSTVVGIEHVPELVEWSIKNLKADGLGDQIKNGRIKMVVGDGRKGSLSHVFRFMAIDEIEIELMDAFSRPTIL